MCVLISISLFYRYAEQQAEEEELALSTAGQATEYVVAATLELVVEPGDAIEGSAFGQQPKLRVLDNSVSCLSR